MSDNRDAKSLSEMARERNKLADILREMRRDFHDARRQFETKELAMEVKISVLDCEIDKIKREMR